MAVPSRKRDEPVRLTRIYTGGGDRGETSLGDGSRVPKLDCRIAADLFERHEEVWLAEENGRPLGFLAIRRSDQNRGEVLEKLYVDPEAQNRGVGTALLDQAKAMRPDGFVLWVFQENEGARRFYERHGFRLVELTDGADNMEREPDALYEWKP